MYKLIWRELRRKSIAKYDLDVMYNSEIFKYTPYKRLTEEQHSVVYNLVVNLLDSVLENHQTTTLINGETGTGKTVLAMYLMKLFADKRVIYFLLVENEEFIEKYESIRERIDNFKTGLVVPMTSLRGTLRKVARNIDGLNSKMIVGPNDVAKDMYDLLIVDESHRLYPQIWNNKLWIIR